MKHGIISKYSTLLGAELSFCSPFMVFVFELIWSVFCWCSTAVVYDSTRVAGTSWYIAIAVNPPAHPHIAFGLRCRTLPAQLNQRLAEIKYSKLCLLRFNVNVHAVCILYSFSLDRLKSLSVCSGNWNYSELRLAQLELQPRAIHFLVL